MARFSEGTFVFFNVRERMKERPKLHERRGFQNWHGGKTGLPCGGGNLMSRTLSLVSTGGGFALWAGRKCHPRRMARSPVIVAIRPGLID